jgi:hypothetical protein
MRTNIIFDHISLSSSKNKNTSDKFCRKIEIHILCSVMFFPLRKSCRLSGNGGKYCTFGQATVDSMEHAHCMLDS